MAYDPIRYTRSTIGLLIAPIVGSMVFSGATGIYQNQPIGQVLIGALGGTVLALLIGAGPATLLFRVPIYLLLRRHVKPRLITAVAIGVIIGLLPAIAFGFAATWPLLAISVISAVSGPFAFWWIARDEIARNQAREI